MVKIVLLVLVFLWVWNLILFKWVSPLKFFRECHLHKIEDSKPKVTDFWGSK